LTVFSVTDVQLTKKGQGFLPCPEEDIMRVISRAALLLSSLCTTAILFHWIIQQHPATTAQQSDLQVAVRGSEISSPAPEQADITEVDLSHVQKESQAAPRDKATRKTVEPLVESADPVPPAMDKADDKSEIEDTPLPRKTAHPPDSRTGKTGTLIKIITHGHEQPAGEPGYVEPDGSLWLATSGQPGRIDVRKQYIVFGKVAHPERLGLARESLHILFLSRYESRRMWQSIRHNCPIPVRKLKTIELLYRDNAFQVLKYTLRRGDNHDETE
jgi:hypothetical protein